MCVYNQDIYWFRFKRTLWPGSLRRRRARLRRSPPPRPVRPSLLGRAPQPTDCRTRPFSSARSRLRQRSGGDGGGGVVVGCRPAKACGTTVDVAGCHAPCRRHCRPRFFRRFPRRRPRSPSSPSRAWRCRWTNRRPARRRAPLSEQPMYVAWLSNDYAVVHSEETRRYQLDQSPPKVLRDDPGRSSRAPCKIRRLMAFRRVVEENTRFCVFHSCMFSTFFCEIIDTNKNCIFSL